MESKMKGMDKTLEKIECLYNLAIAKKTESKYEECVVLCFELLVCSSCDNVVVKVNKILKDIIDISPQIIRVIKRQIEQFLNEGNIEVVKWILQKIEDGILDIREWVTIYSIVLIYEKEFSQAEKLLLGEIDRVGDYFDVLYNLAYLYEIQVKLDKSIEYYNRSLFSGIDIIERHLVMDGLERVYAMKRESVGDDKKNNRIYFVLEHLGGEGGVETVLITVTNELATRGYDVHVLMPDRSDNVDWEMRVPRIHYYDSEPDVVAKDQVSHITNRIVGLGKLLNKIGMPKVLVATHVPITAMYSRMIIGDNSNVKLISWLHNPLETFGNQDYIKYADKFWTIATSINEEIEDLGILKERIIYLGNPVDINVKRIPIAKKNKFVYIGRLENNQKRVDLILKSFAKIKQEWELHVYGQGEDGEMLIKLANELKISQNIYFHGYKENPWECITEAKALLLSSDFEGFGLVLVEAMARGLPVITTKCTGPRDIVRHKENGLTVEKGSIEEYCRAIEEIIEQTDDKLNKMGNRGIELAKKFAVNRVINVMQNSFKFDEGECDEH